MERGRAWCRYYENLRLFACHRKDGAVEAHQGDGR